jgi:hypothetical protein
MCKTTKRLSVNCIFLLMRLLDDTHLQAILYFKGNEVFLNKETDFDVPEP